MKSDKKKNDPNARGKVTVLAIIHKRQEIIKHDIRFLCSINNKWLYQTAAHLKRGRAKLETDLIYSSGYILTISDEFIQATFPHCLSISSSSVL